jgi:hypothetical protein
LRMHTAAKGRVEPVAVRTPLRQMQTSRLSGPTSIIPGNV